MVEKKRRHLRRGLKQYICKLIYTWENKIKQRDVTWGSGSLSSCTTAADSSCSIGSASSWLSVGFCWGGDSCAASTEASSSAGAPSGSACWVQTDRVRRYPLWVRQIHCCRASVVGFKPNKKKKTNLKYCLLNCQKRTQITFKFAILLFLAAKKWGEVHPHFHKVCVALERKLLWRHKGHGHIPQVA